MHIDLEHPICTPKTLCLPTYVNNSHNPWPTPLLQYRTHTQTTHCRRVKKLKIKFIWNLWGGGSQWPHQAKLKQNPKILIHMLLVCYYPSHIFSNFQCLPRLPSDTCTTTLHSTSRTTVSKLSDGHTTNIVSLIIETYAPSRFAYTR